MATTERITSAEFDARVSERGVNSGVTGPVNWCQLHTYAFGYPVEEAGAAEMRRAKQYVEDILPFLNDCVVCQMHARAIVRKHPPNLTNRDTFSRWTVWLHNVVNANAHKPQMSYEQACAEHEMRLRATGAEVRLFYGRGGPGSITRVLEMREFWYGALVTLIIALALYLTAGTSGSFALLARGGGE